MEFHLHTVLLGYGARSLRSRIDRSMVLSPCVWVFISPREQYATHATASPRDGLFEVPEVEHENVRDCAHKDCDHNVRYESCTLRESVHAIDRLSTFSGHSFLLLRTTLTVPSTNGMYAIVTSVSKRMFPFCSDVSRPSATDEAE